MKYKKVLCGMLAAALLAGTFTEGIAVNAAETTGYSEAVEVNSAESDFQFDSATGTITKYIGTGEVVVVPSTIGGVTVKTIGADCFASNENIISVEIPQGVSAIEDEAFINCPNLQTVIIPKGVVSLGQLAFFMCEKLENVTMGSGITTIGTNTFYGCVNLQSIQLPDTVTKIEGYAFMGCSSLESLALPISTSSIGTGAFQDCSGLKEITIPSAVTTIEEEAFDRETDMKIICEEGSKAYEYAHAYGITNNVDEAGTAAPIAVPTKAATTAPTKAAATTAPTTGVQKQTTYSISYVLNGGKISGTSVKSYDGTANISLPSATRKGYTFAGWYTESSYKTKVTALKKGTTGNKTLYAKWTKVTKPSKPTISALKNTKSKQMSVKLKKKVSGAKGYEMVYATNKKFTKSKKTVRFTAITKTVKNLKKGKTYYVKVRAYKLDSTNSRVYGSYSSVKKISIKK